MIALRNALLIFAAIITVGAGSLVRAEVYEPFELGPVDSLVVRLAGTAAAPPNFVTVQGQHLRIARWTLPIDLISASQVIEADMHVLLGSGDTGRDAIQIVTDDYALFAALSEQQSVDPTGAPRYARTVLLRALNRNATELVVTDDVDQDAAMAPIPKTSQWSLNGVAPQWTGVELLPEGDLVTTMFVYPAPAPDLRVARTNQLQAQNFELMDVSQSENGMMLSARRGPETLTSFFYIDQDGAVVEIISYQGPAGSGGRSVP